MAVKRSVYDDNDVKEATLEYFNGDELATNVWMTKYALKTKGGGYLEKTPEDMHRRLAKEFARIEAKYVENALTEEEIFQYLDNFKYIVPQGSPMFGIGNDIVDASLSNCVVVDSPDDTVSSIIDKGRELANLFKRRCGVGIDISTLRPEGSIVANSAGTTSGAWSFADFYSYVCRMIGQAGRRGALMITIDVRHPDIMQFVSMKSDLEKVTGANVSVKISDDFMRAVSEDSDFNLHWPVGSDNPKVVRTIKAVELWDHIVKYATEDAEPGLLMWDNLMKELPAQCYHDVGFNHISTNPCAEICLSPYDSCRLISINLKNFVKNAFNSSAYFDFDQFSKTVKVAMRLCDDLVDLEVEKLERIIEGADTEDEKELWGKLLRACKNGRRTGLGTHGLADAISRLGLRYDSDEGIEVIDLIYKTLRDHSYSESVSLAKERGAFPVFDWKKEKDNSFINRLPQYVQDGIAKYGRRNISILTNAPTGSVSIVSQTSSGIEPVFRNYFIRRRKLGYNEKHIKADFVDKLGDRWQEYKVYHHNVQEYIAMFGTEDLPEFFVQSDEIDWEKRVEVQAALQKYIDHSVSSTINLPKGTSQEVVGRLYRKGWELGLKGITVYVDGCRDGVLVTEQDLLTALKSQGCISDDAELTKDGVIIKNVRLPEEFENGPTKVIKREGNKYYAHFSYVKGCKSHPVALWIYSNNMQEGEYVSLNRATRSLQKLLIDKGVDLDLVIHQVEKIRDNPHHERLGKMVGMCLRHNIPLTAIVGALEGIEGDYISSTLTAVRKFLKGHIKDGTKANKKCNECGSENVIYESGCDKCLDCGGGSCG